MAAVSPCKTVSGQPLTAHRMRGLRPLLDAALVPPRDALEVSVRGRSDGTFSHR
jgi:hypothetical protein